MTDIDKQKNNEENNTVSPAGADYSGYIKIACFNVASLAVDKQGVIDQIKAQSPDIVGIQELDKNNARHNEDQIRVLAQACGYEYYGYDKAIDLSGGEYGHGILSKYPIKSHTTVAYKVISPVDEDARRVYGRYALSVKGKVLYFYNTHITLGDMQYVGAEIRQLTDAMANDKYAVCTGDFNAYPSMFMEDYVNNKITVLNGGGGIGDVCTLKSFPAGDNPTRPIDNILCTENMKYYWDENTNVGVMDVRSLVSDHNMIYTYIDFPG